MKQGLVAALFVLVGVGRAAATDITACGQTIVRKDTGVLTVDLSCSSSAEGVFLDDKATLQLNGHTITGGGVECIASCTVTGPGTITGVHTPASNVAGIVTNTSGERAAKFTASELDVHDNDFGIVAQARRVTLTDVNASSN